MKLRDALQALLFSNVSIFFDDTKRQYRPTRKLDETGRKYLEILAPRTLNYKVTKILPTAFGYANVHIVKEIENEH